MVPYNKLIYWYDTLSKNPEDIEQIVNTLNWVINGPEDINIDEIKGKPLNKEPIIAMGTVGGIPDEVV